MKNLILELSKVDRKAALIFNREIRLRNTRGELKFKFKPTRTINSVESLIDSFNWNKTKQGYVFWDMIDDLFENVED